MRDDMMPTNSDFSFGSDRLKREPFWLVWNPRAGSPTHKHSSEPGAIGEAKRLARQNPGQDFFVLEVKAGWTVPEPPVVALEIDPEFIPF